MRLMRCAISSMFTTGCHLFEMLLCAGLGARLSRGISNPHSNSQDITPVLQERKQKPRGITKISPGLQVLRVRAECKPRFMRAQSQSRFHTAGQASLFLSLHSGPPAPLRVNGIYCKSVCYSISPCSGSQKET